MSCSTAARRFGEWEVSGVVVSGAMPSAGRAIAGFARILPKSGKAS
jgi:hypothetical protein